MRHTKILSLLLCLALVLTLLPGMHGTAHAASKYIQGRSWKIGDSVDLGSSGDQNFYIDDRNDYQISTGARYAKVPTPVYNKTYHRWEFKGIFPASQNQKLDLCLGTGSTGKEIVTGFKWVSGTGEMADKPFRFALTFDTSVGLSEDTIDLTVGGTKKLTAAVYPSDAADRTVQWSVGGTNANAVKLYADEDCQNEINYGVATSTTTVYVKGMSEGEAAVTVTANTDSSKTATCAVTVAAHTAEGVSYMNWDGTKLVPATREHYKIVDNSTTTFEDGEWYVVNSNVTVADRITVSGTAHLILCDGAKLTANNGIQVAYGKNLTIYGQANQTGQLEAAYNVSGASAIGSKDEEDFGGAVTINGGNVAANGAAGVENTYGLITTNATINGGVVNATGNGSGISSDNVTVNKGKVTTVGSNGAGIVTYTFTINGGDVTGSGGECGLASYDSWSINDSLTVLAGENEAGAHEDADFIYNYGDYTWAHIFEESAEPELISSVAVTGIDAPVAGQDLDTTAESETANVTLSAVAFAPESADGKASYATVYTAAVTATAAENYAFADNTSATVNGKTAVVTKNQDGTLTISYTFEKTALNPVVIKTSDVEKNYSPDGVTVPLDMFEIPAGAGTAAYSVSNVTGEGTYNKETNTLTVTKCGTFTVSVNTAATATHSAGAATAILTVNKADITPVVTLEGWTMGETSKTPSVTGNLGGGAVTYSYKLKDADDSAYSATVPSAAGVYTVKADIAATAYYNAASATADFTIAKPTFGPADFILPQNTRTIGDNAFESAAMKSVDAKYCTAIGAGAFKNCQGLQQICLPENCAIDATAFEGCGTVYVFAYSGGTTETWCQGKDNIVFVSLGE